MGVCVCVCVCHWECVAVVAAKEWEMLEDADTQATYFHHIPSGLTTWEVSYARCVRASDSSSV